MLLSDTSYSCLPHNIVKQTWVASGRQNPVGQVIGGCRPAVFDFRAQVEIGGDGQVDDPGSYFQFPIGLATVTQTFFQTFAWLLGFGALEAENTVCDACCSGYASQSRVLEPILRVRLV